jgi:GT2 family glycosyltransferase
MSPSVTVIIITFNSSSTIKDCLLSLNSQIFRDFDVVLVDNGSQDNTRSVIQSLQPLLTLSLRAMYLDHNLGFAGGNNVAFGHALGHHIALLNPDAFPTPHWLEALFEAMEYHPDVGICASKLIVYGHDVIDSAGDGLSTALKGFKRGEGSSKDLYQETEYLFGSCGGASLYRKRMLDDIGFFDEEFFLIHEDTELNFRANLTGWRVIYVPKAIVYHKVHSSIGKMSSLHMYYNLRNAEFVRIKNVPFVVFLKHLPALIIFAFAEFFYFAIRHWSFRIYVRAKYDVIRSLPALYKRRKVIMQRKTVDNKYVERLLTPVFHKEFFRFRLRRLFFD